VTKVRQIEEANKFELASSIKALVARALADEMIEGGMSAIGPRQTSKTRSRMSAFGGKADIGRMLRQLTSFGPG
jgi:hypothetical protein